MYGIVNKAIEDLVLCHFGFEKWEKIKERSGIDIDYFISNEPYDDAITYQLAGATAEVMNMPLSDVLKAFGEWWILKTGKEKYGALMTAGGSNLKAFLLNLPHFHNRIYLIYPKLTPPEFQVTHVEDKSLHLHYFSKREGLQDFMKGLIQGLGLMFETPVQINLIADRNNGDSHDVFKICWS